MLINGSVNIIYNFFIFILLFTIYLLKSIIYRFEYSEGDTPCNFLNDVEK